MLPKRMEARIGTTRGTKGKQAVKRRAQHPRPRQGRGIHQERRGGMEHKKGDIRKRRWRKERKAVDNRRQAARRGGAAFDSNARAKGDEKENLHLHQQGEGEKQKRRQAGDTITMRDACQNRSSIQQQTKA